MTLSLASTGGNDKAGRRFRRPGREPGNRTYGAAAAGGLRPWRGLGGTLLLAVGAAWALAGPPSAPLAAQVAPDTPWRTLETEHFLVTFPHHLEGLARRAGERAEVAYDRLTHLLEEDVDGAIELLLTDDVDRSNGFASVTPARRVTVYVRPPVEGFALSNFDDWLDLVITHEVAHIVHLDATGRLGGLLRTVFGSLPAPWPFFPGLGTPRWTIEGLATWYESALTPAGRVRGTFFDMMLRTAALEGAFEGIGAASGDSPAWPDGERPYLYGSHFFDHLLDRYGQDRMARFVDAVGSQWIPYRLNSAARDAFGVSFSDAWGEWSRQRVEEARAQRASLARRPGGLSEPQVLTDEARIVAYPRVGPGGCVLFAQADGRSDPGLRLRGEGCGPLERLEGRTNGVVPFDWTPDGGLLLAQPEFRDPYRIRADLWRVGADGTGRRLTRGARLDQPATSPDGRWAAAVRYEGGTAALARVDLADGQGAGAVQLLSDPVPDDTWGFPDISPDGRWIAATRWTGGRADVWVVDATSGEPVLRVTDDRALDLAPRWSGPEGHLVWSSDRSGIAQIVQARVDPVAGSVDDLRQLTRVVSGALFPAPDPVGGWLYFSWYTAMGWELARLPYDPSGGVPVDPVDPRFTEPPSTLAGPVPDRVGQTLEGGAPPVSRRGGTGVADSGPEAPDPGASRGQGVGGYRSLASLRPRFWQPILLPAVAAGDRNVLDPFLGVETRSSDLVGRHELALRAAVSLGGGQVDGRLQYSWAGLGNPVFSLTLDQEWDGSGPLRAQAPDGGGPALLFVRERERRANLAVTLLRRRWWTFASVRASGGLVWERRQLLDRDLRPEQVFRLRRTSARLWEGQLSATLSNARRYALSYGIEEGGTLFLLLRSRLDQGLDRRDTGVAGLDRSRDEILAQGRYFTSFRGPGHADHVVGVRVSAGAARGPGADAFTYDVGGAGGQAETFTGLSLFGGEGLFFPIRGYETGVRTGRYAWTASVEYRFPLALVNRAPGLFPFHLDRLHGALFADAGNAWGPTLEAPNFQAPRRSDLVSVGAELRSEVMALYSVALSLRLGVAQPLVEGRGVRFHIRLGSAF